MQLSYYRNGFEDEGAQGAMDRHLDAASIPGTMADRSTGSASGVRSVKTGGSTNSQEAQRPTEMASRTESAPVVLELVVGVVSCHQCAR